MFKNVSGQKITVYAFDSTTNLPKTGDAANLTAYVSKDDGSLNALTDTSATEVDATNAKGYYIFDVAQTESNADKLLFSCKSSTANIVVLAVPSVIFTVPPNFSTQSIDSSGRAVANVTQWNSSNVATPVTAGVPVVEWIPSGARQNTAQAGTSSSITLDASASATADFFKYNLILTLGGTGAGQGRICTAYNGSSKVASVVPNWTTAPDNTTKFLALPIGLTDVESWLATAVTSLVTPPTNFSSMVIDINGRIDLSKWLGVSPNALTSGRVDAIVGAYASGQAPLQPTVAGRTLDVSAGGEAGLDWANIGSPTTVVNLSGTSTKAVEPTVAGRTLDVSVGGEAGLDWANIGSPTTSVNLSGTTIGTLTTNSDKTGYALGTNGLDSGALTAAAKNAIADSILDRNMATGTDSGTDSTSVRTVRQALRVLRNKNSISGGTQTVFKEDDATSSFTAAVTTTAGNPISAVDPT